MEVLSVSEGHATVADLPRPEYSIDDKIKMINGALYFACRMWVQGERSIGGLQQGQPAQVIVPETVESFLIPSQQVKQRVLVLCFDDVNLLFSKSSGFDLKGA